MNLSWKYPHWLLAVSMVGIAAVTAMGYKMYLSSPDSRLPFLQVPAEQTDSLLSRLSPTEKAGLRIMLLEDLSSPFSSTQAWQSFIPETPFSDPFSFFSIPPRERETLVQEWAHLARIRGEGLVQVLQLPCGELPTHFLETYLEALQPLKEVRLLLVASFFQAECVPAPQVLRELTDRGIAAIYLPHVSPETLKQIRAHFPGLILTAYREGHLSPPLSGVDIWVAKDRADRQSLTGLLARENEEEATRRVMQARQWSGLQGSNKPVPYQLAALKRKMAEAGQILVNNQQGLIPFSQLSGKVFFQVTVGAPLPFFEQQLQFYAPMQQARISRDKSGALPPLPIDWLKQFNPLLIALNDSNLSANRDTAFFRSWRQLEAETQVVAVNFSGWEGLLSFVNSPTLLHCSSNAWEVQDLPAQLLFGGVSARGKIPFTLGKGLEKGRGSSTEKNRLGYSLPEQIGLGSENLSWIDSILQEGIRERALPGGQVLVAMGGNVIYHKAFGFHTYNQNQPVSLTDLYDLASITKVAGTTLAAMGMYEAGKIDLDSELIRYFADTQITHRAQQVSPQDPKDSLSPDMPPDTLPQAATAISQTSPVFKVKIRELLTHHSGLPPALPIQPYLENRDSANSRFEALYQLQASDSFRIEVAKNFYLRSDQRDSLWHAIKHLKRSSKARYEYSDANLILLQQVIDTLNQAPISQYLSERFYRGLGMQTMGYRPIGIFSPDRLVPTAYDAHWRRQLLRGYVHDPTAALFGGIAGNAGLFSNANDLAILFQMLLNGGTYGGERFLEQATIKKFTEVHAGHRGFGFDKLPSNGYYLVSSMSSQASYGHTGFTGTVIWVDPEYKLVYVFLSNRVHPSEQNWRINTLGIRRQIHDVIYNSIGIGMGGF